MVKKRKKQKVNKIASMGQAEAMKYLQKQNKNVTVFGIVILICTIAATMWLNSAQNARFEIITALEQYRLGTQNETYAIQSLAETENLHFLDTYNIELEQTRNKELGAEVLKNTDMNEKEWELFNEVQEYEDSKVSIENQAISAVKTGQAVLARAMVFGEQYETLTENSRDKLTELTETVQRRKRVEIDILVKVQLLFIALFVFAVYRILKQFFFMFGYAKTSMLDPIVEVSEQIVHIAGGDFSQEINLKADETEVGKMVQAIEFMKENMHAMVGEIADVLENMGNGDYRIETKVRYVGEFKQIEESLQVIREKMKETFKTLRTASDHINSGSEQLASAAQDLAEGSTTQATQMADLVVMMKNMAEGMENNAAAAKESVNIASQAGIALQQGNEKMEDLKVAISEISKCSEQISTIISTIEDIASQTNLLSLNAAIEAARAGEAGRGFAVVAEQVKNLAEESAKASGRTTELIETTIRAVERGISIADDTTESMLEVMQGAMVATQKMGQIAELLDKEVENIHTVNDTIATVTEVVDSNSATSEETAAVSQEQKAQVETMVQLIDFFEI